MENNDKCFCHLAGFRVKDAEARQTAADNKAAIEQIQKDITFAPITVSQLDTCFKSGWYQIAPEIAGGYVLNNVGFMAGVARVEANALGMCKQTIFTEGGVELVRFVSSNGQLLGAWECPAPPLNTGVEYRTTERFNGNAVYVKLINCGTLPATASSTTAHGCQVGRLVRCIGQTKYGNTIPSDWNGQSVAMYATPASVVVTTTVTLNDEATAILYYTKV